MLRSVSFAAVFAAALAAGAASAEDRTPAPPDAKVYFVNLENGAKVKSPVRIVFGLSGMGVAPAGTEKPNTGHHHLLIDRPPLGEGEEGEEELMYGLPADEHHMHFGGGQTEVVLDLPPGRHTLQLVLGDLNHVPHDPPIVSEPIEIIVE